MRRGTFFLAGSMALLAVTGASPPSVGHHLEEHQSYWQGEPGTVINTFFCDTFEQTEEIVLAAKEGGDKKASRVYAKWRMTPSAYTPADSACKFFPGRTRFIVRELMAAYGPTFIFGKVRPAYILRVATPNERYEFYMFSTWTVENPNEKGI